MKVLFQSRKTLYSVPGGDTVQIVKTAEALRRIGVEVDISTELQPDLGPYRLVHLFNITRPQELYLQAENARIQKKKIVLSPVYVSYDEYERKCRTGIAGFLARNLHARHLAYLKVAARALTNLEINRGTLVTLRRGYGHLQEIVLRDADMLLPNSESEMRRLTKDFPMAGSKAYEVVRNAVDTEAFDPDRMPVPSEVRKFEGCVLCVGRIEGIKNQLNLVRAMRDLPWQLILAGKPGPNHLSYYERLKSEAGRNVHFIGEVPHSELPAFYKAAKVHALVSWFETTGLSSLEAGAMNCNLVITNRGDTADYFGNHAYYCEPDSIESIRSAIVAAHEAPRSSRFRHEIISRFNWGKAAADTLRAYDGVIRC